MGQSVVAGRVDPVEAASENGDRWLSARDASAMCHSIDTDGEPAPDHEAGPDQRCREVVRCGPSVCCWCAAADDGYRALAGCEGAGRPFQEQSQRPQGCVAESRGVGLRSRCQDRDVEPRCEFQPCSDTLFEQGSICEALLQGPWKFQSSGASGAEQLTGIRCRVEQGRDERGVRAFGSGEQEMGVHGQEPVAGK